MADFKRGIKAGAAAATVYLIVSVILELTGFSDQFGAITMAAGLRISLWLGDPSSVTVWILPLVVRGIVFGAVFAALYNFLPGVTSIVKGVLLSSFLWIVTVIEVIYTTPGWPWHANGFSGSGAFYSGMISLSSVGLALAGIISALAFGTLTGFLWDRFRPKRPAEARKGSPVLLVSFILGLATWVIVAVLFLLAVVINGAPAVSPESWFDLLATSVVFLGLPGWILARAGWKKTKVDKSGFKWGMAGGVIMALTGIMLLPGALAIAGGVFSKGKPAGGAGTAVIAE